MKALKTQSAWHKATLLVRFGSGDCYAGRHMPFHDYQSYQTLGYTDILIYEQKMSLLNCQEYTILKMLIPNRNFPQFESRSYPLPEGSFSSVWP